VLAATGEMRNLAADAGVSRTQAFRRHRGKDRKELSDDPCNGNSPIRGSAAQLRGRAGLG
jgi:hypothetical protein